MKRHNYQQVLLFLREGLQDELGVGIHTSIHSSHLPFYNKFFGCLRFFNYILLYGTIIVIERFGESLYNKRIPQVLFNKSKYIIALSVSILVTMYSGCSGSRNLYDGYSIPAGKLIGSWKTDYNLSSKRGILTFRPDSTFVDSVFTITADSLKLIPELIVRGTCFVEGPFIKIRDAVVLYPDFRNPGAVKSWQRYIDNLAGYFRGETLYLQPVIKFESGGVFYPLPEGEWITKRWICTYNQNISPPVNNGFVKETYYFDTLAQMCRISKEYLFENSPAVKDTMVKYAYSGRELTLGVTDKKWIVFHHNKTYWFNQNYYSYKRYEPRKPGHR